MSKPVCVKMLRAWVEKGMSAEEIRALVGGDADAVNAQIEIILGGRPEIFSLDEWMAFQKARRNELESMRRDIVIELKEAMRNELRRELRTMTKKFALKKTITNRAASDAIGALEAAIQKLKAVP